MIDTIKHVISRVKAYKNWYSIVWPMTRLLSRERILETRAGPMMYVRNIFGPDFVVVHEMFFRDDYGVRELHLNVSEPVIVDAGGNIGVLSLLALATYPNARILCYEPEASNLDIIRKNVRLNAAEKHITCFKEAIDNTTGMKTFYLSQAEYAHSLEKSADSRHAGEISVATTTIERIMQDNHIKRLDLLKLDIEGTEYSVLRNLPLELYPRIKNIVLEIHDHPSEKKEDLVRFLAEHGYAVAQSGTNPHVFLAQH